MLSIWTSNGKINRRAPWKAHNTALDWTECEIGGNKQARFSVLLAKTQLLNLKLSHHTPTCIPSILFECYAFTNLKRKLLLVAERRLFKKYMTSHRLWGKTLFPRPAFSTNLEVRCLLNTTRITLKNEKNNSLLSQLQNLSTCGNSLERERMRKKRNPELQKVFCEHENYWRDGRSNYL